MSAVPRARKGETILVVEDNEGVREYAKEVLEELGYRVVEAGDADQALGVLNKIRRVDLLFTDVVLPGPGNGRVLATRRAENIRTCRSSTPPAIRATPSCIRDVSTPMSSS